MAKVNDKNIYPVKPKPTSDDILFGSDSEKNYKSSNFKIADITDVIKEDINFDDIANIPKNTSQLVNDGEDGVHKFVDSVGLDTAISDVKDEILGITDDKISDSNSEIESNLKDYADTNKKLLEAQMELQDKALRGELTNKESELLQALENQRREQEKKLDEVSESLTTDLDTLKNQVDKESGEVQDAINNFQNQLNGLPTDVELTEVQLENLRFLLNTVEAEYADINFKITVVLRDQLLPAEQKPILEALQLSTRVVYNELRDSINQALLDKTLTEEEKLTINTNLDAFRLKITEINLVLIDMYDLIGEGRKDMIEQQIKDSIVNLEPKVEYSPDKVTWHSGEFREGIDFYMRIKYGDKGDWSNPIRIVGENGSDGKYQANEFSKNTSLTNPPTSGWQDAPPTVNSNEYIWMRVGDVIPPATEPSYWTAIRLTGGKGTDGKDGQNAIVIDLTNDNSSVPATFEGVVLGDIPGTKAIVYEGSSIGSGWLFSAGFGNASGTIDSSTGDVVINTISDDLTNIKITATKQGYSSLTINYTISKVRAGEPGNGESASVYYLSISENVVKVNNKGVITPSTLTANVYLKIGSSDPIISSDTLIKYQYNDGQEIAYTTPITVDKNKTMITFRAYSAKGDLLDLESVPIIRDGTDGNQGIPGKAGADGRTPYFHTAWANSEDGKTGFSTTVSKDKSFIGTYTDFTQADSTDSTKYKWSKIRGESIVSATEPTGKYIGMVWIDTSKSPIEQKYWNGTIWVLTGVSQSDIAKAIKEANDALKKTMEDALSDGIISNNEALEIANNISSLVSTKSVLDSRYSVIYNDKLLSATKKTDLQNKKTDFDLKHTALLNVCIAISKKTSVTPAEVADYKSKQTAYNTSLSALSKVLEEAQNEIFINGIDGIEIGGRNLFADIYVTEVNGSTGNEFKKEGNNNYLAQCWASYIVNTVNTNKIFKVNNNYTISYSVELLEDISSLDLSNQAAGELALYNGTNKIILGTVPFSKFITMKKGEEYQVKNTIYLTTNPTGYTILSYSAYKGFAGLMGRVKIRFKSIKIEKGYYATDWTPAPEDIDNSIQDAINNAAQAQNIANAANSKVNFLTATSDPKTGLISGGALLVGDSVGNNAGVVGVTDDGQSSVRFYAGAAYNQKKVAPFRVQNDGKLYALNAVIMGAITANSGKIGGFIIEGDVIRSANNSFKWYGTTGVVERYDKNGTLRHREGVDSNGAPEDTWFDENGNVMYTIDSRGTHWSQFTPESYSKKSLWRITTSASYTKTQLQTALNSDTTSKKRGTGYRPADGPSFPETWSGIVTKHNPTNSQSGYSYSAGNNPESHSNKQYEGFVFTSENKLGTKVADGWYMGGTLQGTSFSYQTGDTLKIALINCIQISGGKIVKTEQVQVRFDSNCNFKPGETSTPEIALGTITVL